VMTIALGARPTEQVLDALKRTEKRLRTQNAHSATIEVLREFRELWEIDLPSTGAPSPK